MVELYREQLEDGHYFLHEHPRYATSWQLKPMQDLMACQRCRWLTAINVSTAPKHVAGNSRGSLS